MYIIDKFFFFPAGANALSRFAFYTLQCPKNSRLVGERMSVTTFFSLSPYREGVRERGGEGLATTALALQKFKVPAQRLLSEYRHTAPLGCAILATAMTKFTPSVPASFFEVPAAETTMCALQSSKFPNYTQHTRKTTTAASPQRAKPQGVGKCGANATAAFQ